MTSADWARLAAETMYLALLISAPALLAALAIGFFVGVLQAATQVQDYAIGFVPKLVAVALALVVFGGFMSSNLLRFADTLWRHVMLKVQ